MKKIICPLALTTFCLSLFSASSQNFIDKYLVDPLVYTTIANAADGVNQPRDLDFKPNSMELWIVNNGNTQGGSNVVVFNAGQNNQFSKFLKDSHNDHFMMYPSAIAFSDIGEWASTSEIKNTNGVPNSTFMGPALWSADTNIHARVFQNNWQVGFPLGSHLDMLHQSPFAMGIAHESEKIYWVADCWNGNICKYNFVEDHGPGYDDHSAGMIWRYTDFSILRQTGIPGHLVMDKSSKWLYVVDAGNKRVFRVNTNTGTDAGNLFAPNEPLASYKAVTGAVVELIDMTMTQPCGIDFLNDRLVVSDYSTGDIRIYNTAASTPSLMGTIATGQQGIMGVKIAHDGKIWFVNNTQNTVVRIDPSLTQDDAAVTEIITPSTVNFTQKYHFPDKNVCAGSIAPVVTVKNNGSNALTSVNINYFVDGGSVNTFGWTGNLASGASTTVALPATTVTDDAHLLKVYSSNPNGVADNNVMNDTVQGSFRSKTNPAPLPFIETFTSPIFPPAGWSYLGYNKFCPMSRDGSLGSYGGNDGCLFMNNTGGNVDVSGQKDYFISPRIDFSTTGAGTELAFDLAHAQYSGSTADRLEVKASIDCGITWSTIYDKSASQLATTPPTPSFFYPDFSQWRTEIVPLDAFIGQEVMFLFATTSNYGNNLYIDNIMINYFPVGIDNKTKDGEVRIYPNPSSGNIIIENSYKNAKLPEVYTILGLNISNAIQMRSEANKIIIDLSEQASGAYFVNVETENGLVTKKIMLQK